MQDRVYATAGCEEVLHPSGTPLSGFVIAVTVLQPANAANGGVYVNNGLFLVGTSLADTSGEVSP